MIQDRFDHNLSQLLGSSKPKHLAVAVSGGSDSIALLFFISSWCKRSKTKLSVLSVNHNLRTESCDEVYYVQNLAKDFGHDFYALFWSAGNNKSALQERAREGRYDLMSAKCLELGIPTLLVAHHFDDMLETYLMRKRKKSGIFGLSSSRSFFYKGIQLLRPLFNLNKDDLLIYLKKNNIKWLEDSSNQSDLYERNRVRKEISRLSDSGKSNLTQELSDVNKQAERLTQDLISGIAESVQISNYGFALIDLAVLLGLHQDIKIQILNYILTIISGKSNLPRYRNLEKLLSRLKSLDLKCSLHGCIIKRIAGSKLIVFREKVAMPNYPIKFNSNECWDGRFEIIYTQAITNEYVIDSMRLSDYIEIRDRLNLCDLATLSHNNHKSILFTLPVVKKGKKIVAIPNISYYDDGTFSATVEVIFRSNFTSRFTHFF